MLRFLFYLKKDFVIVFNGKMGRREMPRFFYVPQVPCQTLISFFRMVVFKGFCGAPQKPLIVIG